MLRRVLLGRLCVGAAGELSGHPCRELGVVGRAWDARGVPPRAGYVCGVPAWPRGGTPGAVDSVNPVDPRQSTSNHYKEPGALVRSMV